MQGTRRLAGSAQQRARIAGNPRCARGRRAGPKAISADLSKREQECSVPPHLLVIGLLAGQQPKPAPWYMLPTRTSPAKRYLRAARIPGKIFKLSARLTQSGLRHDGVVFCGRRYLTAPRRLEADRNSLQMFQHQRLRLLDFQLFDF